MWRTGSSFDGEDFRLSDPSLYRVLDEADMTLTDMTLTDMNVADYPSSERRSQRATRRHHRERWQEERG